MSIATEGEKVNNSSGEISALELARYVIWYADENHVRITQLKLQKLLYFIQIEFIKQRGTMLFDDPFEAWTYGPVVRDVYYEYCSNGSLPLHSISEHDGDISYLSEEDIHLINDVLNKKMRHVASRLVQESHSQQPWLNHMDEVRNGNKPVITTQELMSMH